MEAQEPMFPDKRSAPRDADLARVLGRVKKLWDEIAAAAAACPGARPEWKHYGKRSGWVFVVRGKRSNLMYMVPREKHFGANFALGEKAVQAAMESDLPAEVVEMIRQSKKYPEGRAVRLAVKTAADVRVVKKLLVIKVEH